MFLDNNLLLKAAFHDKQLLKCIKTALFGAKTKKSLESGRQRSGAAWGNPRH